MLYRYSDTCSGGDGRYNVYERVFRVTARDMSIVVVCTKRRKPESAIMRLKKYLAHCIAPGPLVPVQSSVDSFRDWIDNAAPDGCCLRVQRMMVCIMHAQKATISSGEYGATSS